MLRKMTELSFSKIDAKSREMPLRFFFRTFYNIGVSSRPWKD